MSFEVNEYLVSAFTLLLHAFALLNIMTCDFTSFILLLASSFYADQLAKKYLNIKQPYVVSLYHLPRIRI